MLLRSSAALSILASLSQAQAQYLVSELSFGYGSRIIPEHHTSIPNFAIQGNPNLPEVLSNKIILTPPAPGNQRSGVWADRPLMNQQWVADVDFRANGPERGGGNLNIWLVRDGSHDVGSSSVYTANRFEGLVLVIDQHAGSAGKIRGFLNDGTKDFKTQAVDGLSFGHCDYAYRNLGRPSQIKLRQTATNFRVEIDGHQCFESDSISIPTGYKFGITAASADNPDSFEIFKLVVMTETMHAADGQGGHAQQQQQQQQRDAQSVGKQAADHHQQQQQQQQQQQPPTKFTRAGMFQDQQQTSRPEEYEKDIPDEDAGRITSSKAQFADLHNRLQSVNHHLSTIFRQVAQSQTIGESRHQEVSVQLGELKGLLTKLDRLVTIEDRVDQLEREMKALHGDLKSAVDNAGQSVMYQVSGHLKGHHDTILENMESNLRKAPGHTRLILVIVGSQVFLALAYVIYKRRRANSPKKYL